MNGKAFWDSRRPSELAPPVDTRRHYGRTGGRYPPVNHAPDSLVPEKTRRRRARQRARARVST